MANQINKNNYVDLLIENLKKKMKYTMVFLNKIKEVKKFQVINGVIYIIFKNKLRIIGQQKHSTIDFNSDDLFIVSDKLFSDENFYYNTREEKILILDLLKDYYYTGIHFNNNLVFTNQELAIYSLEEKNIFKNIPFFKDCSLALLFKDKFLSRGSDFYSLYDLSTLNKLWKYSFSELLKGKDVHQYGNIVVHNDILYMYLADNKDSRNFATVAIDILTGEKIATYAGFGGDLFLYRDKIGVASTQKAQILNTKTNEIKEYNLSEFLEKDGLNIGWNSFVLTEGDILYFIADDHRQGSHIGIINLVENKLVWLYDINGNKDVYDISIRSIKVAGNRLYAHCSDNTLHIFE